MNGLNEGTFVVVLGNSMTSTTSIHMLERIMLYFFCQFEARAKPVGVDELCEH
jgi:hypothetical protein